MAASLLAFLRGVDWSALTLYSLLSVAGAFAVAALVRLAWYLRGQWRVYHAAPRPLLATTHRLWSDPGPAAALDLRHGPGGEAGVPVPPFTFVQEHLAGSQPCVAVRDARGRTWRVKWGHEVRPESFAVRVAGACGYFAEVTHFVAEGTIEGAEGLTRAKTCIGDDFRFTEARFELEDPAVRTLFEEHSWAWHDNPFVGTPQLTGLKLVVMLISNWDTKDRRDVGRGSNTAIFEHRVGAWRHEARYLITDWGGAMGRWGNNVVSRGRWDPEGFAADTPYFVTGVQDGLVSFGYQGQRTEDVAGAIPVAHVEWFCQYVSQLNDERLREGLLASGATDDEATAFTASLLDRIGQLQKVCAGDYHREG